MRHPHVHDAVIAGAGPVGLFLSCELRSAGLSVLVLERSASPRAVLKGRPFGMRGLTTPTLDAFARRGLLDALVAARPASDAGSSSGAIDGGSKARRAGGHFAGIQFFLDKVDPSKWAFPVPDRTHTLATDMASVEAVLEARAVQLGVEIRRGFDVEGCDPSDDGVTVQAGGALFHGRWLVGCDGGRSTVRKSAGFTVAGTAPEFTGYSVDVELDDPESLEPGRHYTPTGMYTFARPGIVAMVDFDAGAFHRSDRLTLDHVQAVLRRVSGVDVTLTALKVATTWTDRAFQATAYRKGRVLLAGDAAHIHSPLGGQGLNLGLGDAMNLGWKLAATIRGDAPDELLDTYFGERHPVGAQVLDWSRAQVALMRPTPSTRALAAIVRDLVDTGDGATYFADRVWGASLRYEAGDHPLVGRSVPDFMSIDGSSVSALLATGRGLLLDFGQDPALREVASRWRDRIDHVAGDPSDAMDLAAVLVRPDGVVAWASADGADDEGAAEAARRWFGLASGPGRRSVPAQRRRPRGRS